jgi:UDP-N-acetylmuramoyl-tripeptide--D-alanyl-D-alanine ligase
MDNLNHIEILYSIYKKYNNVFIDSRNASSGGIFFGLKGDQFDGNNYVLKALEAGADFAVTNNKEFEGHDSVIVVDDTLETLQQLANYHRKKLSIPIIAITGTNGKTTTKELINSVLSQKFNTFCTQGNLNNHIGVPLSILSIDSKHEIAVIEMGANHLGEIAFLCAIAEPDYGIITNVGYAHLEGFGSFDGVKRTKAELYHYINTKGKGIFINTNNQHLLEMAQGISPRYTYTTNLNDPDADLVGDVANNDLLLVCKVLFDKGWLYIKTNLTGDYNLENVLAACRIGKFLDIDPLLIQKGIENYIPSNNRSQVIQKWGSKIISDCYNANPSSMELAIKNLAKQNHPNKIVILGDMLELGDESEEKHQQIADLVKHSDFAHAYFIGNNFCNTRLPNSAKCYQKVDDFIDEKNRPVFENNLILIKGSRGIALEKILDIDI